MFGLKMNSGWPIRSSRSMDEALGHLPPKHISHRKSVGCGGRHSRFSRTSFNICRRFRLSATALHFSYYQIRRMLLTKAAWVSLVITRRNRLKYVYWRLFFFSLGYLTSFVVSSLLGIECVVLVGNFSLPATLTFDHFCLSVVNILEMRKFWGQWLRNESCSVIRMDFITILNYYLKLLVIVGLLKTFQ